MNRSLKARLPGGLTLIELLMVVAIVAILSALAIPHLARVTTRARVARAKNDLRVIVGALETYHVDQGGYPTGRPTAGVDPFGVFAFYALGALTTPVAYLAPSVLKDPFGPILHAAIDPAPSVRAAASDGPDRPFPPGPEEPSFLYFNYFQFAGLMKNPRLAATGFAIISSGPDRRDSFAVYYPFPRELPAGAGAFGILSVSDTIYDPTNGTISAGDIGRWGGALPSFTIP